MSPATQPDPISTLQIEKEYGVVFEALLEYHNPDLTVFHTTVSRHQQHLANLDTEVKALTYIKPHIRTDSTTLCEGNGSSADPASLGIPALLLHLTNSNTPYLSAARRQLDHLLSAVPRLPNDAISHREAAPSAWADFVYMVPPFIAYYGVYIEDEVLVREAVRQCSAYFEILKTQRGLWMHILSTGDRVSGEREKDDEGLWSTSNGWAAAGMTRVLSTVRSSRFAEYMQKEQDLLVQMIDSILLGALSMDTDNSGLLRNYLDNENWWSEVSGTALLAATVFRMAVLRPDAFGTRYIDWALQKTDKIVRYIDSDTGVAAPVVNPLNEGQDVPLAGVSPEGQAFVVLMYAAWRDWAQSDATLVHS